MHTLWHRLVCNVGWQDVLQYLTRKKRLMQKLNAEKTAKTGALLLASQCCQLAHTIWSENRSVIKEDELVELLVDHADICMDLVNSAFVWLFLSANHFLAFKDALCTSINHFTVLSCTHSRVSQFFCDFYLKKNQFFVFALLYRVNIYYPWLFVKHGPIK